MKVTEEIKPLQRLLEASKFMLSDEVKERFQQNLKRFVIPKGRVLVNIGQVSPFLYFIEKGVMRTYYVRGSEDITSLLVSDGDIVCIAESFLLQTLSNEVLETLEDTIVYAISYDAYRKLVDLNIAQRIVDGLSGHGDYDRVLEIGPGMGVLTQFLLPKTTFSTYVIEIDTESVAYLQKHYEELSPRIIEGDFLKFNPEEFFPKPFAIIGNFPYNISSQIFFRALQIRDRIPEIVCMLQKEVAMRIASPPGNKDYGILSVLLQAFYDIDYLVSVPPGAFDPPPKVQSGVIRLRRNAVAALDCDEKLFFRVVKTAFNQRRKTLRNALKPVGEFPDHPLLTKRAEQLSVSEFVTLTQLAETLTPQI